MLLPSVSGGGKSGLRPPSRSRHRACRGPGRHPGHRAAWTKGLDWFLRRIPTSSRRESSGSTKDASASTTPGSRSTNGSSWGSSRGRGPPRPRTRICSRCTAPRRQVRTSPSDPSDYATPMVQGHLLDAWDAVQASDLSPDEVSALRYLVLSIAHTLATKAYDEWESSRAGEFTPGSWLEHFATIPEWIDQRRLPAQRRHTSRH